MPIDAHDAGASNAAHKVFVCLAVLRLPHVHSEVLMTLHAPMDADSQPEVPEAHEQSALLAFKNLASSIHINDWTLFGCEKN